MIGITYKSSAIFGSNRFRRSCGRWGPPGSVLRMTDVTLPMSNQIIKRWFFENIDFHQKFPVESFFLMSKFSITIFEKCHRNFQNLKIWSWDFRWKFSRFLKFSMKIFENHDGKFWHPKNIFDRIFSMKIEIFKK